MKELILDEIPFSAYDLDELVQVDAAHTDEEPASEPPDALHQLLSQLPPEQQDSRLTPVLGNEAALRLPRLEDGLLPRFVEENLILARPNPNGTVEERRMHELHPLFERAGLILDRHGNRTPGYDWAMCHPQPTRAVRWMMARLGIERVLLMPERHWGGRYRNYLGLDISPNSMYTAEFLKECVVDLLQRRKVDWLRSDTARCYIALPSIHMGDARRLSLPETYKPFKQLPGDACQDLGLPLAAVSLGADNEKYGNRTNCWSETALPYSHMVLM